MIESQLAEYKRIRTSVFNALIAVTYIIVSVFGIVLSIAFINRPEAVGVPHLVSQAWVHGMSTVSAALAEQATPVPTSLTVATIATALVLTASFTARPEGEMPATQVVRLHFLEVVTRAFCKVGGVAVTASSAILPFAGTGAVLGAITALGSGILTLSLGAMVPISAAYWSTQIEAEKRTLTRLLQSQPKVQHKKSKKRLWTQLLAINFLLRMLWLLGSMAAVAVANGLSARWGLAWFFLFGISLVMTALWDAPLTSSWMQFRTDWITDRSNAYSNIALWACVFTALIVAAWQMASEIPISFVCALFAALFAPRFILTFLLHHFSHLDSGWRGLRSRQFEYAIKSARENIARFEGYHGFILESDGLRGGTHPTRARHRSPQEGEFAQEDASLLTSPKCHHCSCHAAASSKAPNGRISRRFFSWILLVILYRQTSARNRAERP